MEEISNRKGSETKKSACSTGCGNYCNEITECDSNVKWTTPITGADVCDKSENLDYDATFENGMCLQQNDMGNFYEKCNWSKKNFENPDKAIDYSDVFYGRVYGNDDGEYMDQMALNW